MGVNLRTRKSARALVSDPQALDDRIVAAVRQHGSRTGVQLLAEVKGPLPEVVDRLARLVARDVLRHDGRAFSLRQQS